MKQYNFPTTISLTDFSIDTAQLSPQKKEFLSELALHLSDLIRNSAKHRVLICIAGPSGSGKTYLSLLLEALLKQEFPDTTIHAVSIDGFHFPNAVLQSQKGEDGKELIAVKGRYDTYDVEHLLHSIQKFLHGDEVCFPGYSRISHEPVKDKYAIKDARAIVLLEGLWVLSDLPIWKELRSYSLLSLFLTDAPEMLQMRTIERHVRGGKSKADATRFYKESDMRNTELVLHSQSNANLQICWPKE